MPREGINWPRGRVCTQRTRPLGPGPHDMSGPGSTSAVTPRCGVHVQIGPAFPGGDFVSGPIPAELTSNPRFTAHWLPRGA